MGNAVAEPFRNQGQPTDATEGARLRDKERRRRRTKEAVFAFRTFRPCVTRHKRGTKQQAGKRGVGARRTAAKQGKPPSDSPTFACESCALPAAKRTGRDGRRMAAAGTATARRHEASLRGWRPTGRAAESLEAVAERLSAAGSQAAHFAAGAGCSEAAKTGDGGNRARMVVGRRLATIESGQAERLPARVPAKREREAGKKRSRGNRIGTAGPKGRRCQSGTFLGKCRARNLRMVFSVTPKYLASFGVVKPRACSSPTLSR